jgi:hypothetical protein
MAGLLFLAVTRSKIKNQGAVSSSSPFQPARSLQFNGQVSTIESKLFKLYQFGGQRHVSSGSFQVCSSELNKNQQQETK